jgi:hypothetical protein
MTSGMTTPSGADVVGRAAVVAPPVLHSPAATTAAGERPAHFLPPSAPAPPSAPPAVLSASMFGRPVLVAGCHGGAGTTTLAQLVGAYDVGLWQPRPTPYPVVTVARGTAQGAARAAWLIRTALAVRLVPVALVIVGDGPWPEPRLARLRLHMLNGQVPALVRLPYVPSWRYLDDPARHPPKRMLRALERLRVAVHSNTPGR